VSIVCIQGCMSIVLHTGLHEGKTALERQDLSRTYLAHHELESVLTNVIIIIMSVVLHTGLHEGLKTLSDGGTPPKLLIIDDGWQCTDVDVPLRKPMTSRMLMIEEMRESMEGTQDEFIDAELEWLARGAKDLPPSSSAGSCSFLLTD
jgi:hypothetical protein